MHACTAIMGNFLPHARVMAESFLEHHPDARVTVLVVDGDGRGEGEPFEIVRPWELGLDIAELHRVLTLYENPLPSLALRGALMRHLLEAYEEPILYLDSDTQVFGSLHETFRLAHWHGVVLSPHFLDPPRRHHGFTGDRALLLMGAFNSGFLAVGPGGVRFLEWWAARAHRWTLVTPTDGYYDVQRWLDLVPAMFPHHVVDDPGCNVMTLNAHERQLNSRDGRWFARDGPLRVFHFGGAFDPRRPYLIGPAIAQREALFSEHTSLAELHRRYAEALLANGWDSRSGLPASIELEPDVPLDATMRALYREALLASEEAGTAEPPNPYTHGSAAFIDWLRAPSDLRRNAGSVSRYLQERWHTGGMVGDFPDLLGGDASRYLAWARSREGMTANIPASLTKSIVAPCPPVAVSSLGVNIVASDGGLAEFVGQRLTDELRAAGQRVANVSYPRAASARLRVSSLAAAVAVNDVTIVCLPPRVVADFDYDIGVLFRPGRHIILALVDSIWSTSDLATAAQTVDEVWCWDADTAARVGQECDLRVAALPFPALGASRAAPDGNLVCWADLGEPGHSDAITKRVSTHIRAERNTPGRLDVCLSDWQADPLTFETLWGLAEYHGHLTVRRAASWREAIERAHTVLSLGSGIGPVEAEALDGGIDVVPHAESQPRSGPEGAGTFGAAAVDHLTMLRANRTA